MGTMPVNRLLLTMSLPMVVSMLVQALYNVVDSMFVAQINQDALSAVSMVFPIQNLMIAFGVGIGVGVNALLSRSLGQGDSKRVNDAAVQGAYVYVVLYLIFLAVGLFFSEAFMRSQTDIESIISYGRDYMWIVCVFSFGLFTQLLIEKLLQGTGRTVLSMLVQGLGAIINIVLDPILIFGKITLPGIGDILTFEPMGVAGAAAATVIGQCIAALFAVVLNHRLNHEVKMRFRGARPEIGTISTILAVGIPSSIMGSIGSVMTYGMNRILIGFSSVCVSVFGAYFKLQSFVFMPVFGLNNGLIPIVAYNYGARKKKRITGAIKYAMIYSVSIMIVGTIIMQIFPAQLLKLFDASDNMLSIGVTALRIISTHFFFAGFDIIIISSLQALGRGLSSMLVSFTRQLVVLLPVAYLLSLTGKLDAIWWAFPIAEIFSIMASLFFLRRAYNAEIKPMAD